MPTSVSLYHRHRFPAEIISHCVWLYFRFALSFRDVEEMLAMRGVALTYETVREWCHKFGQTYANSLRRKSPRPGDQWHLDEVFLKIDASTTSGALSIRMATYWISCSKADEIRKLPRSSFAIY
jgi:putative transposase